MGEYSQDNIEESKAFTPLFLELVDSDAAQSRLELETAVSAGFHRVFQIDTIVEQK